MKILIFWLGCLTVFMVSDQLFQHWLIHLLMYSVGFSGILLSIQDENSESTEEEGSAKKHSADQEAIRKKRKQDLQTRLLGDVAHELRNTLSLVLGPLSILKEDLNEASDNVKMHLDTADRNAHRLSNMIDQLVDLTRMEVDQVHLKKEAYNLTEQLKLLLDSYLTLADQSGVSFTRLIPDREIIINADRERMEQVFSNLLSNAIKFSPEGGYVDVSVTVKNDGVWIQVKDTGVGIPDDMQDKLFDRYYTRGVSQVENREGLGIGLSMSYEFVKKHGGKLEVESAEGQGAAFKVWMPLIQDDTLRGYSIEQDNVLDSSSAESDERIGDQVIDMSQEELEDDETYALTVLIVEDDEELRSYIGGIVKHECQVAIKGVSTVNDAWEILQNEDIDLVITDLQLPGEDGFSLITQIQDSFDLRLLPILIITGRKEKTDRIRGFQIGINDFMSKPFDPKELVVRVQNLLRNKIERDLWSGNSFPAVPPSTDDYESKYPSQKVKPFQKQGRTYHKYELMLLEQLVEYVSNEITNSTLTVEDLAHKLALSTRQLYRKCKELTGLTPAHLIREIRLYQARLMLEDNKVHTVNELIREVGFSSSGYFSKLYEERYGRRPSDYL